MLILIFADTVVVNGEGDGIGVNGRQLTVSNHIV